MLPSRIEIEQEVDGRWIADYADIPGAMAYGMSRDEAIEKATALLQQVLLDRQKCQERSLDSGHD